MLFNTLLETMMRSLLLLSVIQAAEEVLLRVSDQECLLLVARV
jgi:hypothetical protein